MHKWNDHFGKNVPVALFLIPFVCGVLLLGKETTVAKNEVKSLANNGVKTLTEIEIDKLDASGKSVVINNTDKIDKRSKSGDSSSVVDKYKSDSPIIKKELKLPKLEYGSVDAPNKIRIYLSPTCSSCANVFLDNIEWICNFVDNSNGRVSVEVLGNINSLADKEVTREMYKVNFSGERKNNFMSCQETQVEKIEVLRSFKLLCSVFKNQKVWKESKSPKNVLRQIIKYNDKYIKGDSFSIDGIVAINDENVSKDNIISKNDTQNGFDESLDNWLLKKYMVDYKEFSRNENLPKIHIFLVDKDKIEKFSGNLSQQNIRNFIEKTTAR